MVSLRSSSVCSGQPESLRIFLPKSSPVSFLLSAPDFQVYLRLGLCVGLVQDPASPGRLVHERPVFAQRRVPVSFPANRLSPSSPAPDRILRYRQSAVFSDPPARIPQRCRPAIPVPPPFSCHRPKTPPTKSSFPLPLRRVSWSPNPSSQPCLFQRPEPPIDRPNGRRDPPRRPAPPPGLERQGSRRPPCISRPDQGRSGGLRRNTGLARGGNTFPTK